MVLATQFTVALVAPSPEGTPGGMATVVRETLNAPVFAAKGITIIPTWSHSEGSAMRKMTFAILAAARILFGRRPQIVHIHAASGRSIERKALLLAAAKLRRLPVLLHLHGADLVEDVSGGGRLHRRLFHWCVRTADRVITLSEYWADWLAALEPASRVEVIPNAVPIPPRVQPLPAEPTILFLGRLGERKGIWTLLSAVKAIVDSIPEVRLLLAGDGEIDAVKNWLTRHPKVERQTEVLGWVSPSEVPRLIDAAWVLALPSRNEGLPMSVLEAMSRGRCVVAAPVGGIPDVVRHGQEGFLTEPDDAEGLASHLFEVLGDPVLTERMGAAARCRIIERHDLTETMEQMSQLYQEVRIQ